MRPNPVRQLLRPARLGVAVVRGAHGRHEDLRVAHLASCGLNHIHGGARVINETPASRMKLAQNNAELVAVAPVGIAEPAQLIAVEVNALVLLPGQGERHAFGAHRGIDTWPVRFRALDAGGRLGRKEQALEFAVAH